MSNNPQGNNFIEQYNFSRRVVDHRMPHDLNFAVNQPYFTKPWLSALKQRYIGKFIQSPALFGSLYLGWFSIVFVLWDAWYRDNTENNGKSIIFSPKQQWGQNYLWNEGNKKSDLGRWNHNFYCWEKQPNCGRDFD